MECVIRDYNWGLVVCSLDVKECPRCEGDRGYSENGEWVECSWCEGDGVVPDNSLLPNPDYPDTLVKLAEGIGNRIRNYMSREV